MMDYTEAELEARIFPSVDIDPMDLMYDDWVVDTSSDCETEDSEPYEDESWMDGDALASAGFGTDEDYGGGGEDW
jgi:hypothetical protein